VALVDTSGAPPRPDGDGSDAAAVLVADPASGQVVKRLERNEQGTFFRVSVLVGVGVGVCTVGGGGQV
jgi:hypothetical protein